MLKTSPSPRAEEWAIHDYEGFGHNNIAAEDIITIARIAVKIIESRLT
ncbi:MAG: antirestriction protein ArdA [Acidimicrobiia bacterium]|nr:antirestriction protein ArdA [Acidimicrobiia bacterium]MCY4458231.1 hypothetical protein [Acidimicrobiaceae bacterium]